MDAKQMQELQQRVSRRAALLENIRSTYPDKQGAVVLCAAFEREREPFFQDSTFTYFVGIDEPGLVFYQKLEGQATLYEPHYATARSVWLPLKKDQALLAAVGIEKETFLGEPIKGYSLDPLLVMSQVKTLVEHLSLVVHAGHSVFVPLQEVSFESAMYLRQLCSFVPGLFEQIIDISPLIGQLRRKKDMRELELMYRAIEITASAQDAAAQVIRPEISESQVQAAIDFVFADNQAVRAFPSIVGSGKNSTVLHYVDNKSVMKTGDLVVVDIGASYNHYAADVTRTYPVSGSFTARQKEIYQLVLDAQTFVAEAARPGMYLRNAQFPDQSLHHLAAKFFEEHGYGKYFPHGVGHFVGLDVHDVEDRTKPLQPGDVFTIEPGLYIPEEKLGVRIEDMYWIVEDGVVCLTEGIIKEIDEVEELMLLLKGELEDEMRSKS